MKFEETDCVEIKKELQTLIYFLIKNEEVIYVGQTVKGIERPFSHNDKDFDSVYVKYCSLADLDEYEDIYIKKYKPKYNKIPNRYYNITIKGMKDAIKETGYLKYARKNNFNKILNKLNIKTFIMSNVEYITTKDYRKILDYITVKEEGL